MAARPITWLFDLDNTLHDTSAAIFPRINALMNSYIAARLQLDAATADHLRQSLWHRYGATLLGLIKHHQIDPHEFLRETHCFGDDHELAQLIRAERGLARLLKRLPGRKILLTNAPRAYAERVLFHLGIDRHFERCYAIEQMQVRGRFLPKPSRTMLAHVLARERIDPRRCVFVEDSVINLKRAKVLGLRTVLITGMSQRGHLAKKRPNGVDLTVKSIAQLPRATAHLR